jgi:spore germination protein KA/spore germination protein
MSATDSPIAAELAVNLRFVKEAFADCHDVAIRPYRYGSSLTHDMAVVYCETLIRQPDISIAKSVLLNLVREMPGESEIVSVDQIATFFEHEGASYKPFELLVGIGHAVRSVVEGKMVLLFDGWDKALGFDALSIERRAVTEPSSEAVISGPREGTIEDLHTNIGLLRVRLSTPEFKIEMYETGTHTKQKFVLGYLQNVVKPELLAELKRRVSVIDRTEALDVTYIRELIEDAVYSPFPQYRITERPDVAVSSLLEGKVIILMEGSGTILICPIKFTELFQSAEDYYQRTIISTLVRSLRMIAFVIALTLPSLYIALSTFHPELIPSNLLLAMLDTREGIPFPAFVEAVLMQFFFELLREAGIRLPRPIGSSVSIVGALIIGDAAISAGIASPIMVVVVALTGIASFSIPQYEIAIALRILSFPLMIMAFFLGGFGLMIGFILILLHLTCLRSLGQPYFAPIAPLRPLQLFDVIVRAPLRLRFRLSKRRKFARPD